jgi:UDP-N-acetylmuramate dehydrogenase
MEKSEFLAKKLKEGLREHEVMRDHTTMHVGGVADFYYEAKTSGDLIAAVDAAIEINIPYFILGAGSNVIFSDFGFPGLVIRNLTHNVAFMMEESQVIVDSGVSMAKLILDSVSHNLAGLEFLFGVPGTVGGAIYGDIGANGQSIGDYVKFVTLLIPGEAGEKSEVVQYPAKWFEFGYRTSKLKAMTAKNKPIILSARIQLAQSRQEEIMRRLNTWKNKRISSQPDGWSCGSTFKNSIPAELENTSAFGRHTMPQLPKERTAGYMLDKAGAKKLKVGGAHVSGKHANFIINSAEAKAQDVRQLAEQMRNAVREKFNVELEEEIEYVGQW